MKKSLGTSTTIPGDTVAEQGCAPIPSGHASARASTASFTRWSFGANDANWLIANGQAQLPTANGCAPEEDPQEDPVDEEEPVEDPVDEEEPAKSPLKKKSPSRSPPRIRSRSLSRKKSQLKSPPRRRARDSCSLTG